MSRVLLVDDHELIRQGLARAFERDPDMKVVAQAATVAEALAAWREHQPDVVVTDLQLPDGTGMEIVRAIREESTSVGLVILTMYSSDEQLFTAMAAGASAFVGKDARAEEVIRAAAHAVAAPLTFASPGLTDAMLRRLNQDTRAELSPREREVLRLLAEGDSGQQIAQRLYMAESTAKTHISAIYKKLGATNRAQALMLAVNQGLLPRVIGADVDPPRHGAAG